MTIDLAGRTHVGLKRPENQDEVLAKFLVEGESPFACLAVADGMGGHVKGREASQRAIETLGMGLDRRLAESGPHPTEAWCADLEEEAHESVRKVAEGTELAGTTLTFALVTSPETSGGECLIGHVGDSRAYRFREGRLEPLTEDQTWEEYARKTGTANPHGKALRQALGVEGEFEPATRRVTLDPGDWVVVCSDGLYKMAQAEDIERALSRSRRASEACDRLIELALAGGGRDNIGVCVARFAARNASPAGLAKGDRLLYAVIAAAVVVGVLLVLALLGKIS